MTELSDTPAQTDSAEELGADAAREAWAASARTLLVERAGRYRSVVTHKELAAWVQEDSGVHTARRTHYWMDDLLAAVARDSSAREEPLLSALAVNREGSVGTAYAAVVLELTGVAVDDADEHAAQERLALHRHFEASDLPADGGTAALTPQLAATRARLRKAAVAARPVLTCPTCHMALLPTGRCDTCD